MERSQGLNKSWRISLKRQNFKPHLVIIDSASTDDSLQSIEAMEWSKMRLHLSNCWRWRNAKGKLLQFNEHSSTSKHPIETDLILMTDADAMLEANTVSNLMQWFSDSSIGCVGASPKRVGQRMEEENIERCSRWFESSNQTSIVRHFLKVRA